MRPAAPTRSPVYAMTKKCLRKLQNAAASMLLAVVLIGTALGRAEACAVCIAVPETTAADRLIAADVVVLARENPDKPFSFVAVEVLAGELETPEIDLFLDAGTRRRLAHNSERAVVLVRENISSGSPGKRQRGSAETGASGGTWRSLGYASARYEALVREILDHAPGWGLQGQNRSYDPFGIGARAAGKRVRFFMPYLADSDRSSRLLAYLEVSRAPYHQIRIADDFVTPSEVRSFLADVQYVEWHPLYILLFGMDATEPEKAEIRKLMTSRLRFSSTLNLAAWTTAFIESDGEAAIDWLDQNFLGRPGRHDAAIREILEALSVHGTNGRKELRSRIAESYAVTLETHPNAAARAAVDLLIWRDRRFTEVAQEALSRGLDLHPAVEFALANYAAMHGG